MYRKSKNAFRSLSIVPNFDNFLWAKLRTDTLLKDDSCEERSCAFRRHCSDSCVPSWTHVSFEEILKLRLAVKRIDLDSSKQGS